MKIYSLTQANQQSKQELTNKSTFFSLFTVFCPHVTKKTSKASLERIWMTFEHTIEPYEMSHPSVSNHIEE